MAAAALYEIHELQRCAMVPLAQGGALAAQLLTSPLNPFSFLPGARPLAATCELASRLGRSYEKPAWGIESVTGEDGRRYAVQEVPVMDRPFCQLLRFRAIGRKPRPTVLLAAPVSGHHATLLRDTVSGLLAENDVVVTDWRDARDVPLSEGDFGLADYVTYIQDFLRFFGRPVHVVSVCQPTVPVLAAVSLLAAQGESEAAPLSLTLMGGPIDARRSPTQVDSLATAHPLSWFEDNLIYPVPARYAGAGRLVYPGFMQLAGFVAMNPKRHWQSHYDFFVHLIEGAEQDAQAHRRFYDEYNAVMDMPARFYLDTIREVFQQFSLAKGTMRIAGKLVEPGAIRNTRILTIEGELDDISGAGQTRVALGLCSGVATARKEHFEVAGAGHYGIFAGHRWRAQVCPKINALIRESDRVRRA
jgi:poly(3-hydroxybutyrate) depolymerase